jgi:hypothetical protein
VSLDEQVVFDVGDLPLDIFELADRGLDVESLTTGSPRRPGHGGPSTSRSPCPPGESRGHESRGHGR